MGFDANARIIAPSEKPPNISISSAGSDPHGSRHAQQLFLGQATKRTMDRIRRIIACDLIAVWLSDDFAVEIGSVSTDICADVERTMTITQPEWNAAAQDAGGLWIPRFRGFSSALLTVDGRNPDFGMIAAFTEQPRTSALKKISSFCQILTAELQDIFSLENEVSITQSEIEVFSDVLDNFEFGIGFASEDHVVRYSNHAFQKALCSTHGLRLKNGVLSANTIAASLKLHMMFEHAIERSSFKGSTNENNDFFISYFSLRPTATPLTVATFPIGRTNYFATPAAAILIIDPAVDVSRALIPICQLNNLSPVESRLACHLALGKSLSEASTSMRIREQTARTYLRQIFRKTGTSRQAELVGKIISGILPLRVGSSGTVI